MENRGNGKTTGLNIYHFMHKAYERREKLRKAVPQVGKEIGAGSDAYVFLKELLEVTEKECSEREKTLYYLQPQEPTTLPGFEPTLSPKAPIGTMIKETAKEDVGPFAPAGYLNT